MKHSPGPWGVHGSHIYAPDGAIIAQVYNPGSKEQDYSLVANRNLMGAAPELLDAARMMADLVDDLLVQAGANYADELAAARAAIAKAEVGAA
jgi:hypothetical protein